MTHPADALDTWAEPLAQWLSERASGRARPRVEGLRRSDGGYSNVTVLGAAHWSDPPVLQGLVLRMAPAGASVFPDTDIGSQYRVMACLANSAVPVPRLLGFESDARVLGAPFFVMEQVAGRVPNENPLYHLEGWFHDLPADAQRAHWFSGIDSLAAIARLDWRALGLGFLTPPAGTSPLEAQLAHCHAAVRWAEGLNRPYSHLHRAFEWLQAHQPTDEPVALCWGDAKLGNMVFAQGRTAAVLDWEQASLGNPVHDLAWWLMLDDVLSQGYGVPRLAGLPSREDSVGRWERASGHSARELPYYEVFATWRMAYIMARIGTVFTQRGWVPPEAEMDLRNGASNLLARHAQRLGF